MHAPGMDFSAKYRLELLDMLSPAGQAKQMLWAQALSHQIQVSEVPGSWHSAAAGMRLGRRIEWLGHGAACRGPLPTWLAVP